MAGFLCLCIAGILIHYSLMFLLSSVAFWTVRAQGIVWGYYSFFNVARLPDTIPDLLEPLTALDDPVDQGPPTRPALKAPDQPERGRLSWPRNSGRPVAVWTMANRNGRSTTIVTGGGGRNAANAVMPAAVAAAASVPCSSTSM